LIKENREIGSSGFLDRINRMDRMLPAARGAKGDRVQGVRGREIWERRLDPQSDRLCLPGSAKRMRVSGRSSGAD